MPARLSTTFISYRHADNTQEGRRWAEWLHHRLERYVVPPDLIGTPTLRGNPSATPSTPSSATEVAFKPER